MQDQWACSSKTGMWSRRLKCEGWDAGAAGNLHRNIPDLDLEKDMLRLVPRTQGRNKQEAAPIPTVPGNFLFMGRKLDHLEKCSRAGSDLCSGVTMMMLRGPDMVLGMWTGFFRRQGQCFYSSVMFSSGHGEVLFIGKGRLSITQFCSVLCSGIPLGGPVGTYGVPEIKLE